MDIRSHGVDFKLKFDEAYNKLKDIYMTPDQKARRTEYLSYQKEDFRIVLQVIIEGPGQGVFSMIFSKKGLSISPKANDKCDVSIATTFENLLGMANGKLSSEKLFISGRLKVKGNMSKAAALRYMLGTKDISESL